MSSCILLFLIYLFYLFLLSVFFVLSLLFCCTAVASVTENKFLVCVNIPGNKADSDSDVYDINIKNVGKKAYLSQQVKYL